MIARVGILDCKVNGDFIEETERYKERGWHVINARHLDAPSTSYDVLAATWTQLSEKRLNNVGCQAVVVKDNDEPFNVIQQITIDALGVRVQLIDNWGISTRLNWNVSQIAQHANNPTSIWICANTPSHDAIAKLFTCEQIHCDYGLEKRTRDKYDVVIVHLAKADFEPHWFDQFLRAGVAQQLLISTTRGPIMSAKALNMAVVMNHAPEIAVLDWAWQERQLIKDKRIVLTGHTSYRSANSRRELTDVTIKAVDKMLATL